MAGTNQNEVVNSVLFHYRYSNLQWQFFYLFKYWGHLLKATHMIARFANTEPPTMKVNQQGNSTICFYKRRTGYYFCISGETAVREKFITGNDDNNYPQGVDLTAVIVIDVST